MTISTYKKIFIVGCPRSGTTWLLHMLKEHSETIVIPKETWIYPQIYKPFTYMRNLNFRERLNSAKGIIKIYGILPILTGLNYKDLWKGIIGKYDYAIEKSQPGMHVLIEREKLIALIQKSRLEKNLSETDKTKHLIKAIFDYYFKKSGGGENQVLVEKTPLHVEYIKTILDFFPEAKIIEIIRDPRDVRASYSSCAQTKQWAKNFTDTRAIAKIWKKCIQHGEKHRKNKFYTNRIHLVKYEDLRSNTKDELTKILSFAGLSDDSKNINKILEKTDFNYMTNSGLGNARKGAVGTWKSSVSAQDLSIIDDVTGEMLERLGYSVFEAHEVQKPT